MECALAWGSSLSHSITVQTQADLLISQKLLQLSWSEGGIFPSEKEDTQ
jgi:hypothetical protein